MSQSNRLGSLEVGVAGHDGSQMLVADVECRFDELDDRCLNHACLVHQIEAQVGGNLVITGTSGVEFLSAVADSLGQ